MERFSTRHRRVVRGFGPFRWSTPRSFADQLSGTLLDIRKAVDEVDRSISQAN
jgi:hypothetical protein